MESVYSAVRADSLNKADYFQSLKFKANTAHASSFFTNTLQFFELTHFVNYNGISCFIHPTH